MFSFFLSLTILCTIYRISCSAESHHANHLAHRHFHETWDSSFRQRSTPNPNIAHDLGPLLSSNAQIIVAGSAQFAQASQRWQQYEDPTFFAVVQVATADDISKTVTYARNNSIPFLAGGGGHGAISSLANLRNGILISLKQLNQVTVSQNGSYATVQGGATNSQVRDALFAMSKQATTGVGECSGFAGTSIGGGHGFLQGQYGLVSDGFQSATVILANGSAVTASATSNSDLFYAIRGAGQNYGILSDITIATHDVPAGDSWYYANFIYSGDMVEQVFNKANQMLNQTAGLAKVLHYAVYLRIPAIDPNNAVVLFSVLCNDVASACEPFATPYLSLKPLSTSNGTASLPELSTITGNDKNSQICQDGFSRLKFPINIQSYNIPAQRSTFDAFNLFSKTTAFNTSLLLFEAYSIVGVQQMGVNSTAFAQRNDRIIVSPVASYLPNSSLDPLAVSFGETVREIFLSAAGGQLHSYLNYAHGDEPLEALFGYEPWRIAKLRTIKQKYDPGNYFRWFAPLQ